LYSVVVFSIFFSPLGVFSEQASYGGAVNLNMSWVTKTDVFEGCVFYSLEAIYGGAIYTNADVSVRNCRFANNTAENGNGNDVYVTTDSNFYGDPSNTQNTCSLSFPSQINAGDV
jgi:hypothetical protein